MAVSDKARTASMIWDRRLKSIGTFILPAKQLPEVILLLLTLLRQLILWRQTMVTMAILSRLITPLFFLIMIRPVNQFSPLLQTVMLTLPAALATAAVP